MSRQSGRRPSGQGSNGGLRNLTLGGGTIGLCVATVVMTLLYVFVPSLQDALVIEPATADQLSLLSVVTNSFVAARGSLFGLLILFALIGYFVWPQLQSLWRRSPGFIISASLVILVTVLGLDFALGRGRGVGLVSALVPLLWFAGTIESRWGEKRLLMFTGIVIVVVNGFGLLVAYAFPGSFGSLAGRNSALVSGTGPMVSALLTVWCLMFARVRLAILNIEARKLIWVLVILGFLDILFVGRLKGLMTLMAILTAYLLVSGLWRPNLLLDKLRLKIIETRIRRRRSQIRIVDNDKRHH